MRRLYSLLCAAGLAVAPATAAADRKPLALQAKLTTPPGGAIEVMSPGWLDSWFDDVWRRLRPPDRPTWLEEMLRPWRELEKEAARGGDKDRSTRT